MHGIETDLKNSNTIRGAVFKIVESDIVVTQEGQIASLRISPVWC